MPGEHIAIIVVSFNTKELLLECLSSATRHAPECKIILVDNASSDGSAESVRENFPGVTLVENATNVGFAAACNQALKTIDSDFVLLLNSDALLTEGAIPALLDCMNANSRAGAVGCTVLNSSGAPFVTTMNFLTWYNQTLELLGVKIPRLGRMHAIVQQDDQCECSVDWIEGSCMLLRMAALKEVGIFDEQFFMYSEDEDLCWRMKKAGWEICYTSAGNIEHRGGASAATNRPANLEFFYLSQMKLLRKHRGILQTRVFGSVTSLALRLKWFRASIKSDQAAADEARLRLAALKAARASWNSASPIRTVRQEHR